MSIRVGGGYADFELRLNNLRSGVKTAQEQLKLLRRDAAQPIIARFEVAGSAGVAGGRAAGAAAADTTQVERARLLSEARVEATRIAAAQRFVAAETQAQAKLTAARIQSEAQAQAKVEVARIQSANRLATAEQQARAKADAVLLANAARQDTIRQQNVTRTAAAQLAADGRVAVARTSAEAKIEAARITATQRAAAADTAASAKTEAARLAAEARVEAARIAAAQRNAAVEKRLAAQQAGSGIALPRTFAGFTLAGATQLAGAAGLLGLGQQIAGGLVGATREAVGLNARLETATATLGSFTGSAQRTRDVLAAIDREAARAPIFDPDQLRGAAQALVLYSKGAEDLSRKLRTAELLAVLNPDEGQGGGLGGAAFALREALSGDFTSVVERFNLPRATINTLKEGKKTSEEFYQVVVQALSQIGVNDSLIQAQTQTTAGRLAALHSEFRQLLQEGGRPIFAQLGDSIGRLSLIVQTNQGDLRRFAQLVGEGLTLGLRTLTDVVEGLVGAWTTLGPTGQRVVLTLAGAYAASKALSPILGAVAGGFTSAWQAAATFATRGIDWGGISGGAESARTGVQGLGSTLSSLLTPLAAVQIGIAVVATSYAVYRAKVDEYTASQQRAIDITTQAQTVLERQRSADPNNTLLNSLVERQQTQLRQIEAQKNALLQEAAKQTSAVNPFTRQGAINIASIFTGADATGPIVEEATNGIRSLQDQVLLLRAEMAAAGPFINQYGARIGTIISQFQSGSTNAAQFAQAVQRLTGLAAADTFGIVQGLQNLPQPERIQRLESVFNDLLRRVNENPALAEKFLPQLQAIGAELGRLRSQSPIEISIAIRQQLQTATLQSFEAVTARGRQLQTDLAQLDTQYAAQQLRTAQQATNAWSSYLQQAGRARRDFNQQAARAARDFNQGEQKAAADHARRLADIEKTTARDIERIRRERSQRLRDLQREFDIDATRSRQDFDEERQKLLAEGRIAEARELERKFQKDQGRRQEDLARRRSDVVDQGGTDIAEAQAKRDEQLQQERESFARQRLERAAAYRQQRADAATAFAQQQADAAAQAVQQQAAIRAQQAEEQRAYRESRQKILTEYAAFITEQQAKLEQSKADLLAISRLIASGLTEEEARLRINLQNAKREWLKTMDDLKIEMGPAGYRAMVAWQQGAADALTAGIPKIDQALRPMRDRMVPQSPLRAGPLKNHEIGAFRAAQMYVDGFARGLDAQALDPHLQALRERLAEPNAVDSTALRARNARASAGAAAGAARTAGPQSLVITVPVRLEADGQVLGQVVAPHVGAVIADQLAVQVQVVDASNPIGLNQQSFRSIT